MNTKQKGDIAVSRIISRLLELEYSVSIPFGDCQKYDLIFDDKGDLKRVQVKTGLYLNGVIKFKVCSISRRSKGKDIYQRYPASIDYFGVFCPQLNKTYLIPFSTISHLKTDATIRVDIPKNNQKENVLYAKEFEL